MLLIAELFSLNTFKMLFHPTVQNSLINYQAYREVKFEFILIIMQNVTPEMIFDDIIFHDMERKFLKYHYN